MSTHVELRLPRVEIDVKDLGLISGATTLDLGKSHTATDLETRTRPVWTVGLRPTTVEAAVPLLADALAMALSVAVLHPALKPSVVWVVAALGSFAVLGLYGHRLRLSALNDIPSLVVGSAVGAAAMAVVGNPHLHIRHMLLAAMSGTSLVVLGRVASYTILRNCRSRGLLRRNVVLVGGGSRAVELVARIAQHPETGLRVRGVLGAQGPRLPGASLYGEVTDLPDLIASGFVDTVIVGDASSDDERGVIDALRTCGSGSTEIFVLPRLAELSKRADDEVWGVPLLKLRQRRARVRMAVKRAVDVTLASAALLVLSPLVGLAALAVRLEMGRGVIYRQERVGLNGRRFQLLKLRSMRPLPDGSSTEWAPNADRTGRVGMFIRRYSIDELPQLVNVIRGDMSLVGPRPERPEFVDQFGTEFPSYTHRHRAMVGLTGLAAVEGLRGDTSIADRAYFDNWYIEHWSLWLDVKIMVRTASALLKGTGG
jgi:exopolysaccharide biosynthesis polyprenyl glycosylphosphotransferase